MFNGSRHEIMERIRKGYTEYWYCNIHKDIIPHKLPCLKCLMNVDPKKDEYGRRL